MSSAAGNSTGLAPRLTQAEIGNLSAGGVLGAANLGVASVDDTQLNENYVFLNKILSVPAAAAIERLAETESHWTLNEKWFLSKHDAVWTLKNASERQSAGEDELTGLCEVGKRLIEDKFNAVIGRRFEIKVTKMQRGQAVGIHNDSPDGARGRTEGYRLLYYPNRRYTDSNGGHLFFLASDRGPVIAGVRPIFNSGLLMRLSDHSYHAVSRVTRGVRYTVAVLYWGYPLLFREENDREVVSICLRKLIASGLEEVKFGSTTVAYHLYHTFRLLAEWGAPLEVCLAGLIRQVPEAQTQAETLDSVGATVNGAELSPYTRRLVGNLNRDDAVGDERLNRDVQLVRLAAVLEQVETEEDIERANAYMKTVRALDLEMRRRINIEIARLTGEIVDVSK